MPSRLVVPAAIAVLIGGSACAATPRGKTDLRFTLHPMRPPPTRTSPVHDVLHGTTIEDPYRWLEDGDSAEVQAWTAAQNAFTTAVIARYASRAPLAEGIRALLSIGVVAAPAVRVTPSGGRRYFHEKRQGSEDQPVLYVRDGLRGADRPLLDPAALSPDRTTALDWWSASKDGSLVAWGRSENGSEESVLHVRDVASGRDLADTIPFTRHASIAWLPDGSGFYYSRYPRPGSVPPGDENYHCRIYLHRLGEPPDRDALVFGEGRDKLDIPSVDLSPDGRWLVVRVHQGWQRSEVYVRDRTQPSAAWVTVAAGRDALFEPTPLGDRLYLLTNEGASRYRLYEVDYARPDRGAWQLLIAEHPEDVLSEVTVAGVGERRILVATYMHDAATRLARFDRAGRPIGEIPLPALGSAGAYADREGDELFIQFTSQVTPWTVLRQAVDGGPLEVWDRVGEGFVPPDVEVRRIYARSKDGTRVPMFVVHKAGAVHDGRAPAVLYGYGGFNISQTPAFSTRALLTVQRGGVWASAVLRGGGEFGEDWHRAGMLANKQNVIDDFVACAEELIAQKIASPSRLAIMGGSNGGLLVAAAATQRPDLFRAGASLVPLTDMLRYHLFRIGKLWIPEYGSPDDADAFRWLSAYSPYHHVRPGVAYPAMLFATAESDSRVDPMHARKMAARVQAAQLATGRFEERPVLLRVESKAGHGAGKPVTKLVDEVADELSFLYQELGIP